MLCQKILATNKNTWELYAYTGGNDTTSVTLPTGLQSGDVGILFDSCTQTSAVAGVIPTNWTALYNEALNITSINESAQHRMCISYRMLSSGLSGTTVTGINTSAGSVGKFLIVIRPSFIPKTVTGYDFNAEYTDPTPVPDEQILNTQEAKINVRFGYWRCENAYQITGNVLDPSDYAYDLRTEFGGTNVGVNSWKIAFGINTGRQIQVSDVDFGTVSISSRYAVMISGIIAIN